MAGFAVTVAAGFAVLPHDSSQWWLHGMFLADGNRAGFMGWAGNQSLRAIITRLRRVRSRPARTRGSPPPSSRSSLGLTAAYLLDRAGYPVPALLATALTGLLVSPISWDHHWVWIAPAVAVTGHYALAAARRGARGAARWLWALAAGMIVVFAAWPDAPVGERAEPRQLLARLPVGAAQHQPDQVRRARRPAELRRVPLARLPAAVGQRLHPGRRRPAGDPARARLAAGQARPGRLRRRAAGRAQRHDPLSGLTSFTSPLSVLTLSRYRLPVLSRRQVASSSSVRYSSSPAENVAR